MTSRKKLTAAAAVMAAVLGGGVAGAMLGVPALSSAQSTDTTATPTATDEENADDPGHHGRGWGRRGLHGLDTAAEALGMDQTDLRDALRDGKTIAEVAEENNVDVDEVIDALVADANARIDEAVADGKIDDDEAAELRADAEERITDFVNNGAPAVPGSGRGPMNGGPGHHGPGFGPHGMLGGGLDTAAEVLGIDTDDLLAALRDGKTIAEVAEEQNVDVDEVIDALVADAREKITDFVNNGFEGLADDSDESNGSADTDDTDDTGVSDAAA